jgi:hypothetical protein
VIYTILPRASVEELTVSTDVAVIGIAIEPFARTPVVAFTYTHSRPSGVIALWPIATTGDVLV